MCQASLAQGRFGLLVVGAIGEESPAKILVDERRENVCTPIEVCTEYRLGFVQAAPHVHVLRALSGKHENDGSLGGWTAARLSRVRGWILEDRQQLARRAGGGEKTLGESASAQSQSCGKIAGMHGRGLHEVLRQPRFDLSQSPGRAGGQDIGKAWTGI